MSQRADTEKDESENVLPEIQEYVKPTNEQNPYDTSKLNWNISMELSKMKIEYDCYQTHKQNMHEYL